MQIQSVNQNSVSYAYGAMLEKARRGIPLRRIEIPDVPPIYETVWHSEKPYVIWYGSRGGAKSWTKAIFFLEKAMSAKYFRLVFARDTQKNVRTAAYQLFWDICNKFDCFRDKFTFKDTTMEITCNANGNFMKGGSFEQPDSLRSFADPTDFWADEPITREAEIDREAFLDIVGSLRNSFGMPTVFHLTFNPISKETWIYEDFFEKDLYDCEKLFVNYFDNPFCPQTTVDFLESLKIIDPKRYSVDALGHWGVKREGLILPEYEIVDKMPPAQFYGLDFGYTDQTALTALAAADNYASEKKDLFVEELIYESRLQSNDLISKMNNLGISKTLRITCDNARPEMIQDLVDAGFNAAPCKKYSGSVLDNINRVLGYNLKIARGSKNLFDEIKNWVWEMKGNKLIDKPKDGVDHLCFSILYGTEYLNLPSNIWTQEEFRLR